MASFFDNLITDRHHLVLDEANVIRVLRVINAHHRCSPEIRVGNCGWADDPSKWFIHVTLNRTIWSRLVSELGIIRVWNNEDIPLNTVGVVYSTD